MRFIIYACSLSVSPEYWSSNPEIEEFSVMSLNETKKVPNFESI